MEEDYLKILKRIVREVDPSEAEDWDSFVENLDYTKQFDREALARLEEILRRR